MDFEQALNNKKISCALTNLLVITDLSSATKIVTNLSSLANSLGPYKPKPKVSMDDVSARAKELDDIAFSLTVTGYHL